MTRLALVLALGSTAACGARRALPEPAFAAPLSAQTAGGEDAVRIEVTVRCRVRLELVEWSVVSADGLVTEQVSVPLDLDLPPGRHPLLLPWGEEPLPSRVQGTLHGRCTLGPAMRYPFSLPARAASIAAPDVSP